MAQEWARRLYKSTAWERTRSSYLKATLDTDGNVLVLHGDRFVTLDGREVPPYSVIPPGMCERCFRMGEMTPATLVHHKVHLTPDNVDDPEVSLSYDNFMRLCQDCHAFVHSGQGEPRVTFDEHGNGVSRDESIKAQIYRLTETVDERRNIHSRRDGSRR